MDNWKKHLPNWLTYSRMFLTVPIVAVMLSRELEFGIIATVLFLLASLSDYLDGYFARKYGVISTMGKIMDPIADKILVSSTLIMLTHLDRISPLLVIVLLARDLIIGGIRGAAAADQVIIAARSFGKWKTALQMACIPVLMLNIELFGLPLPQIAVIGLWASVALSSISGFQYLRMYLKTIKSE